MSVTLTRWGRLLRTLCCVLPLLGVAPSTMAAEQETRIALVIGNAAYQNAESLINPTNDARMMARSLGSLGFEVDLKTDLDQNALRRAVREFGLQAARADIALVFYAGHGIQVDNENYLLAVDARLQRELDLLYEGLPLDIILSEVEQARKLGLVILDSCRDNPLADKLARSMGIQANRVGRGLARMNDVPSDTLVAFATRANAVAVDGEGRNSPYTTALLEFIDTPGLELSLLFRKVRDSVLKATAGLQEPFTYGSMSGEAFYLKPAPPNHRPTVGTPEPLTVADNAYASSFKIVGPSDPDGDALSVEITDVPEKGSVISGTKTLRRGSVLTVDELAAATYRPDKSGVGKVGSFSFLVKDNRGGVVSGDIPVTVLQSNRPPEAPGEVALRIGRIPLNLREPMDPDGDPLKVTIIKVPHEGSVLLGYQPLVLGDEVAASDLPSLVYHPGSTFSGDAGIFEVSIEDSAGAVVTTSVRIALPGVSKKESVSKKEDVSKQEQVAAIEQSKKIERAKKEEIKLPRASADPVPEVEEREEESEMVMAIQSPEPPESVEKTPSIEPSSGEYRLLTTSNLRAGPSTSYERIARLERGTRVTMAGRVTGTDWYQILTGEGTSGYVFGDLIEKVKGGASEEQVAARSLEDEVPAGQSEPAIQVAVGIFEKGTVFKDCDFCPTLVRVPPGSFLMGSKFGHSSERPQHRVEIASAFAIGVYEVTMAEWNACVLGGGCRYRPELDRDASGSLPVFNVSWEDAQEYVAWLRSETGKDYRLPSETEWEYAARAGTRTPYWWGEEPDESNASCKACGDDWSRDQPPSVGSFKPNPLGIYDMNGSAAEWVADCWNRNYQGNPPKDARAWTKGDCHRRVLRGGSWRHDPSYLTSSSRFMYDSTVRYVANGLRVARSLD